MNLPTARNHTPTTDPCQTRQAALGYLKHYTKQILTLLVVTTFIILSPTPVFAQTQNACIEQNSLPKGYTQNSDGSITIPLQQAAGQTLNLQMPGEDGQMMQVAVQLPNDTQTIAQAVQPQTNPQTTSTLTANPWIPASLASFASATLDAVLGAIAPNLTQTLTYAQQLLNQSPGLRAQDWAELAVDALPGPLKTVFNLSTSRLVNQNTYIELNLPNNNTISLVTIGKISIQLPVSSNSIDSSKIYEITYDGIHDLEGKLAKLIKDHFNNDSTSDTKIQLTWTNKSGSLQSTTIELSSLNVFDETITAKLCPNMTSKTNEIYNLEPTRESSIETSTNYQKPMNNTELRIPEIYSASFEQMRSALLSSGCKDVQEMYKDHPEMFDDPDYVEQYYNLIYRGNLASDGWEVRSGSQTRERGNRWWNRAIIITPTSTGILNIIAPNLTQTLTYAQQLLNQSPGLRAQDWAELAVDATPALLRPLLEPVLNQIGRDNVGQEDTIALTAENSVAHIGPGTNVQYNTTTNTTTIEPPDACKAPADTTPNQPTQPTSTSWLPQWLQGSLSPNLLNNLLPLPLRLFMSPLLQAGLGVNITNNTTTQIKADPPALPDQAPKIYATNLVNQLKNSVNTVITIRDQLNLPQNDTSYPNLLSQMRTAINIAFLKKEQSFQSSRNLLSKLSNLDHTYAPDLQSFTNDIISAEGLLFDSQGDQASLEEYLVDYYTKVLNIPNLSISIRMEDAAVVYDQLPVSKIRELLSEYGAVGIQVPILQLEMNEGNKSIPLINAHTLLSENSAAEYVYYDSLAETDRDHILLNMTEPLRTLNPERRKSIPETIRSIIHEIDHAVYNFTQKSNTKVAYSNFYSGTGSESDFNSLPSVDEYFAKRSIMFEALAYHAETIFIKNQAQFLSSYTQTDQLIEAANFILNERKLLRFSVIPNFEYSVAYYLADEVFKDSDYSDIYSTLPLEEVITKPLVTQVLKTLLPMISYYNHQYNSFFRDAENRQPTELSFFKSSFYLKNKVLADLFINIYAYEYEKIEVMSDAEINEKLEQIINTRENAKHYVEDHPDITGKELLFALENLKNGTLGKIKEEWLLSIFYPNGENTNSSQLNAQQSTQLCVPSSNNQASTNQIPEIAVSEPQRDTCSWFDVNCMSYEITRIRTQLHQLWQDVMVTDQAVLSVPSLDKEGQAAEGVPGWSDSCPKPVHIDLTQPMYQDQIQVNLTKGTPVLLYNPNGSLDVIDDNDSSNNSTNSLTITPTQQGYVLGSSCN